MSITLVRLTLVAFAALVAVLAFSVRAGMAVMVTARQSTGNVFQAGAWDATLRASVDLKPDALTAPHGHPADPGVDAEALGLPLPPEWQHHLVLAFIELPLGYDVQDVELPTLELALPGVGDVSVKENWTFIGDYDVDGVPDLMVAFQRSRVWHLLGGQAGVFDLIVSGDLSTGDAFSGTDVLAVVEGHPHDGDGGDGGDGGEGDEHEDDEEGEDDDEDDDDD
jgi:hypothetical protein